MGKAPQSRDTPSRCHSFGGCGQIPNSRKAVSHRASKPGWLETCCVRIEPGENERVPYVVTEPCIGVKDKSCMTVCPVDCIYELDDMVVINPDECIDCGLCEPECPVNAIYVDSDVPDNFKHYIEMNAQEGKKKAEG